MTQLYATIKRASKYYSQQEFEYNSKRLIAFPVDVRQDIGGEYHVKSASNQYRLRDVNLLVKLDARLIRLTDGKAINIKTTDDEVVA